MTLFIAICDDEIQICGSLEKILIDILDKLNIGYEIDVFSTPEELCLRINEGSNYDLMFLDIEFAKSNITGIEVGQFIRDTNHNHLMSIVYISWHATYALQLFKIRPLDFLVKPLNELKVESAITAYLKTMHFWSGNFTYTKGHDTFNIKIKDITYLESDDRKLIIHLSNGQKEVFYGTLKEIYHAQLERYDFLFIHAKYVVNYDYIAVMKYDVVTLFGCHTTLPISQPKRKEVRTHYMDILAKRRK